ESIFIDRTYNRLLIADEAFNERNIKIYNLEGQFTGKVVPEKYFDTEPEGIALYTCSDSTGYWIMTDQNENSTNKYQIFDRKTLKHLGTFKGEITRNTDGVWVTEQAFGPFEKGAFYTVHNDGSVTAFDWAEIMERLNLPSGCSGK